MKSMARNHKFTTFTRVFQGVKDASTNLGVIARALMAVGRYWPWLATKASNAAFSEAASVISEVARTALRTESKDSLAISVRYARCLEC